MDLGATVCTKKKPACDACPVQKFCASKGLADVENIPVRKKNEKKNFEGYVFVISNKKGEVFIRKRVEKGLLSGLYEFLWSEEKIFENAVETGDVVSHVFTHINMKLKICRLSAEKMVSDGFFVLPENLKNYAFSTLMQKVIKKADLT